MDADERPITDGLRRAIREDGRTPFEIATRAGISPQRLYRFLNGTRGLSLEVLDKLAVVVCVRVGMPPEPAPADASPSNGELATPDPLAQIEPTVTAGPASPQFRPPPRMTPPETTEPRTIPPPRRRGMYGVPGMPARRHPDGTLWSLEDYSKASDREYSRRLEAGQARRAGHERRKQVKKLGPDVMAFYQGLARKERPLFFKVLSGLLGDGRPASFQTSKAKMAMRILLKERPEILGWIWAYPESDRPLLAACFNGEETPPEGEAGFREWAASFGLPWRGNDPGP